MVRAASAFVALGVVVGASGACREARHTPAPAVAAPAEPPTADGSRSTAAATPSTPPDAASAPEAASAPPGPTSEPAQPRELRFAFRPARGPAASYALDAPEDQHRLVLPSRTVDGGAYPVVVALHGQPRRGSRPRDYEFARIVLGAAARASHEDGVPPFVLALPVFRFFGENWPGFDLAEFRERVEALLAAEGLRSAGYYVFGHSGAAGCGGEGLNHAARLSPKAVAFLDTCVGPGFLDSVRELQRARVRTTLVHSVETAGFVPRPPSEYRTDFDFGRVYAPLGLAPIPCPPDRPDGPLRDQPFRCAETRDGLVRAFVVDTGAGEPAHQAALAVGARFFLRVALSGK